MKNKKNRRTLKKRIRRIISLSTLITIVFFSGIIIFIILSLSKAFAASQAEIVCLSIQQEINTGHALIPLGLNNIEQINKGNPKTKMRLEDINKKARISEFLPFTSDIDNIYISIELNDKLIFSNEDEASMLLSDLYADTQSEYPILDRENNEIGTITVRVNPELLLNIVIPSLIIIVFIGFLALVVSSLFSKFLTIPIITPINQLEAKVKAIADDDHQTALDTQIVLKKPLREIESLAESTNKIVKNLKGYNDILETQKETLEDQNEELEAQNEQLLDSKLEIQKHQGQLIQSEKMATVGLLTAAITHEINTPIGAINSNAQIEEMIINTLIDNSVIQADGELKLLLDQLKEANSVNLMACSRITEIIKSLKSYSRLDQAEFQEANINEGIRSVLVLTTNLLKRRITVHEELGDIPMAKCFPGQLNQVFMNIIVNASQAIENEGEIFIKTYELDRFIYISIRDTGSGIKEVDTSKIFNPGFTTKGVGVGLGLGLYLSYNIIQNHRGEISFNSEVDKGTEFIIKIPINNEAN